MERISCILIEDEHSGRAAFRSLIEKHCPEIEIIGEAGSADEGYELIRSQKPQLVFLDINMPGKSGFDLLKMFTVIDFNVIFVSGSNEYATRAFDLNALDHILKPIDYKKLISSVKKAVKRIS